MYVSLCIVHFSGLGRIYWQPHPDCVWPCERLLRYLLSASLIFIWETDTPLPYIMYKLHLLLQCILRHGIKRFNWTGRATDISCLPFWLTSSQCQIKPKYSRKIQNRTRSPDHLFVLRCQICFSLKVKKESCICVPSYRAMENFSVV